MADTRRARRNSSVQLALVEDTGEPGGGELAELREQLAAAGVPVEVLQALEGPGDPGEIIQRLIEAGVLPSPLESLATLLDGWKPLLRRTAGPLDAELTGAEFLGMLRATAPDAEQLPAMLTDLVEQAEQFGTAEALAMLRVLAVFGPADVPAAATAAADRLVAAGMVDCRWVAQLGRPDVGACFGYRDELGAQESIAVTFAYGRKTHAVVVLIDHDLGGGVKDCFVTDRADRVRADFQRAARQVGLEFEDYQPGQARAILSQALSAPPCPAAPDQVEDVHDYLDLLRARVALLPAEPKAVRGAASGAGVRSATPAATGRTVHRVKITLRGAKPPIWRRLEVPSTISLQRLHQAIQEAFGWQGYHLWVFTTPTGDYGAADPGLGHRDAARVRLDRVAPRDGDRIRYIYDFGDGWEHEIVVEDVLSAEPGVAYPRCPAGRRACPPEDCGGIWGYAELLEIVADPGHAEHAERLEWLGVDSAGQFDPAAFDRDAVNQALSEMATVLVNGNSPRG